MTKISEARLTIGIIIISAMLFASIFGASAYADEIRTPRTDVQRVCGNYSTYTPEYRQAIDDIAEAYGVPAYKVDIVERRFYNVKAVDEKLDYAGPGKECVNVYVLSIDGVETPIYAEEEYLLSGDLFDQQVKDIQPAVNAANISGYTGRKLAEMYSDWQIVALNDYIFNGAQIMPQ